MSRNVVKHVWCLVVCVCMCVWTKRITNYFLNFIFHNFGNVSICQLTCGWFEREALLLCLYTQLCTRLYKLDSTNSTLQIRLHKLESRTTTFSLSLFFTANDRQMNKKRIRHIQCTLYSVYTLWSEFVDAVCMPGSTHLWNGRWELQIAAEFQCVACWCIGLVYYADDIGQLKCSSRRTHHGS